MKKIKVLEMIDQPFLGGGQINLLSLARSLDREKFDVSICSRGHGPFVDQVKNSTIRHFPVLFTKRFKGEIIREIAALLRRNNIDILHTHGGVAGFYGRWAAQKCRIPGIVHTLHGIHYLYYRNPFLKRFFILLERRFSRFTDAIIFVSEADKEKGLRFRLAPERKMHVIKNGIDFSGFLQKGVILQGNGKKELGLNSSTLVVGTVARLHRQKGLPYLLSAARKICKAVPQVKILIIGSGPLEKKLKKEAGRLGVEPYVWFMGERKDVSSLLSIFDVFVLPSLWEGLPYVLMEAAAYGKPIVATNVDGTREVIRDGETGILVPPRDAERLARAVILLLKNREYASALGRKINKAVSSEFTHAQMVRSTQNLYLSLIKNA